jgi:membrane protein YdbS with pleckstrin-like domain
VSDLVTTIESANILILTLVAIVTATFNCRVRTFSIGAAHIIRALIEIVTLNIVETAINNWSIDACI